MKPIQFILCRVCRFCHRLGTVPLVLLVLLPVVSFAQTSAAPMKFEYVFDIRGEPGFAIIQDRDGFLWFIGESGGVGPRQVFDIEKKRLKNASESVLIDRFSPSLITNICIGCEWAVSVSFSTLKKTR